MSIDLLDSLKRTFPNKSGQINGWKSEKVHSIIHKVRDIIMFGWSENFSTQGPEHCHIDFCEKVAKYTNNKDVFLTLLKYHVREGHLQFCVFVLWSGRWRCHRYCSCSAGWQISGQKWRCVMWTWYPISCVAINIVCTQSANNQGLRAQFIYILGHHIGYPLCTIR